MTANIDSLDSHPGTTAAGRRSTVGLASLLVAGVTTVAALVPEWVEQMLG